MKLIDVYDAQAIATPTAIRFLYELLCERRPEQSISHQVLPSFEKHSDFVRSLPYREWFLIESDQNFDKGIIGAIYITRMNEIGIGILESAQRFGYGPRAVQCILERYQPLPALPGMRSAHFIAHVAPGNEPSRKMFERLGGKLIEVTYQL